MWEEKFQILVILEVMLSKFSYLKCSFLIGQGSELLLQYTPATVLSRAFRNGMTLKNRPKNEGMIANSLFWGYFYQNLKKSKTPGWGPLEPFLVHPNGTNGHP